MTIDCAAITAKPDPREGSQEIGGVDARSTPQDVLALAAFKYLMKNDLSKPGTDFNGFVDYLERVRKVLIVDTQTGSLIITVKCKNLQILRELWNDYCIGLVNEVAQQFLVTEDVLNELNLTEAKLTTTIPKKEYRACRAKLSLYSGGNPDSGKLKGLVQARRFSSEKMMSNCGVSGG